MVITKNVGLGTAAKMPAAGGVFSSTGRIWLPALDSTTGTVVNHLFQWGAVTNGGSGKDGTLTFGVAFPAAVGGVVFYGNDTSTGGFVVTKTTVTLSGCGTLFRDLSINYPFVASRLLSAGYFAWGW